MEESLNDENKENLKKALKSLSPDCEKVLELYYFKEYDMDSIARELKYKNANTAKSKKSSCMKCLIQEMNKLSKLLLF